MLSGCYLDIVWILNNEHCRVLDITPLSPAAGEAPLSGSACQRLGVGRRQLPDCQHCHGVKRMRTRILYGSLSML
jgi:hypothetical protein